MENKAQGIFQSDVILRTALVEAIADMKKNPWLLDYVFTSLVHDDLTSSTYGQKEVDKAKNWFLKTDVPVVSAHRVNDVKLPCVSIALGSSAEDKNTLGDVNTTVSEEVDSRQWPVLVGPFNPESYQASTGEMTIPLLSVGDVVLGDLMLVVDAIGTSHAIVEVTDINKIVLAEGTVADFSGATIRSPKPAYKVELESASFNESYTIGCHTMGEAYETIYLHSIIVFALLRYRQLLLEARGFDVSTFNSTDLEQNTAFEGEGPVYSRFINLTGTVRHYWPKYKQVRLLGVASEPTIEPVNGTTQTSLADADQEAADFLGV